MTLSFPLLGTIGFSSPWILAGLLFLPALWFLLRVTPPAPRRIVFPAARFLAGLKPAEQAPRKTPWWILLLRILCTAFIIVALAGPVLNPAAALPGHGALRIVIDNGWAAAQTWDLQKRTAASLIARAGRERRSLYIIATAAEPDGGAPQQHGPLAQGEADSVLRGLRPRPWASDFDSTARAVTGDASNYFLSTGVQDGDPAPLLAALKDKGDFVAMIPPPRALPRILRPAGGGSADIRARVSFTPGTPPGTEATVQAIGADGRVLDVQTVVNSTTGVAAEAVFALPAQLRSQVRQVRLAGGAGAGGVLILDDNNRRRTIGIADATAAENDTPLVEAAFYIRRALETNADIVTGTPADLLKKKPDMIVLPDTGALPPDDMDALEKWVRRGGLLLRFAGPRMTQSEAFLTPVPLRQGGRAMAGALSWNKPLHLAPFPPASPFSGLDAAPDVTVKQQILAQPVEGLDKMTWAALDDGTPLITAKALDRGLLVLVHTTATPEWSDLVLSGLFVKLMERTTALAGTNGGTQADASGALQPLFVLDGFGNAAQPGGFVKPIPVEAFDTTMPAPQNPPGLYGRAGLTRALNAGAHLPALTPLAAESSLYGGADGAERDLKPAALTAAFVLFAIDWFLMILLQAGLFVRQAVAVSLVLCLCAAPHPARAAMSEADMVRYADSFYLAQVKTGAASVDDSARAGLEALARVLNQRTSVEPAGVALVDPAEDELSFFPFLYWPVTPDEAPLSPAALHNVQSYLDHGGTILFATRGGGIENLRRVATGLDIPPLATMPENHVLTRSFYLLRDYPARTGDTLWIEENSLAGRDGVSSVIVSGTDWATAWSAGGQDREMAMRFGVNLVVYALTGNYKADQVHLPHILERLGH